MARDILRPAVPEVNTQEELEVGLLTAAGDDKLQEQIASRLSSLFPNHVTFSPIACKSWPTSESTLQSLHC